MLGVLTLRQSRPTIIANIEVERLKLERKQARQQIKASTEKLNEAIRQNHFTIRIHQATHANAPKERAGSAARQHYHILTNNQTRNSGYFFAYFN